MTNITSTLDIDFKYLKNPLLNILDVQDNSNLNIKTIEELDKYKKRVFLLTRDFLKNNFCEDNDLNNIFKYYAMSCIKYLKFKDASEIIQRDFDNYKISNTLKNIDSENIKHNLENGNKLIMQEKKNKSDLETFVNYKKKNKKILIIPKIRDLSNN